jgi:hypothetical protein
MTFPLTGTKEGLPSPHPDNNPKGSNRRRSLKQERDDFTATTLRSQGRKAQKRNANNE